MALAARQTRVLFLNDTARNGGPGRSLYYILKFLDPRAVHRTVVLPRPGLLSELYRSVADEILFEPSFVENPVGPWRRAMVREDHDATIALRGTRLLGNVGRGALALLRLARLLKDGRFDLIYCNGTSADFAGGALARMTGVSALWHVRYSSLPGAVRGLHARLAAGPGVRRILCVSKVCAALFAHCPNKVRVLHNALDAEEFRAAHPVLRRELGLPADAVIFGSHGRILRRKGYVEMVEAAADALSRMNADEGRRARFVVLGDTPEDVGTDHLRECRDLVRARGLEGRFHFLGFRPDVKPYVTDFDVAVVPSVYADPLPRAVIEAMALAKPVIAFDVGGVGEMLDDGLSGTLVRGATPDVAALATAFLRYLRDPELRRGQGAYARRRIEQRFDARAHAQDVQHEITTVACAARAA